MLICIVFKSSVNTSPYTPSSHSDTGLTVQVHLRESNLAPLVRSVHHSVSNDNEDLEGERGRFNVDSDILQRHCSHPLPEAYAMSIEMHTVRSFASILGAILDSIEYTHIDFYNSITYMYIIIGSPDK